MKLMYNYNNTTVIKEVDEIRIKDNHLVAKADDKLICFSKKRSNFGRSVCNYTSDILDMNHLEPQIKTLKDVELDLNREIIKLFRVKEVDVKTDNKVRGFVRLLKMVDVDAQHLFEVVTPSTLAYELDEYFDCCDFIKLVDSSIYHMFEE